jgi:dephospho-CoA kinase
LLIETAPPGFVDRVLVVDCSPERQVQRVSKRDDISAEEVASIVKVQMSREQRLRSADDVITNDEAADRLRTQVEALHARYLALAQQTRKSGAATSSDRAFT